MSEPTGHVRFTPGVWTTTDTEGNESEPFHVCDDCGTSYPVGEPHVCEDAEPEEGEP